MKSNQHNLCAHSAAASLLVLALGGALAHAILVQPHNHMLDDSSLTSQHESSGSLSPFYNDQTGSSEAAADRDIVSIIGDGLARLRFARMLEHTQAGDEQHLSQEMAELIQDEQQREQAAAAAASSKQEVASGEQQASLSSSVASMLLGAAQAAAAQAQEERAERPAHETTAMSSRGNIMELDTSGQQSAVSLPSKSDLNKQPSQWYNPKETIPVLKISSMATPSKYKKVYFRSEKKLVDGAFHSPASEQEESGRSKSFVKSSSSFNSAGVQRRSSRGSSASAPPSVLQDGVIDFLKKFRDVYVQTRPAGSPSAGANLASSVVSAAASSPFASFLSPSSGSGRPNLMGAISTATQMGAMLSQAAAGSSGSAASPSSSSGAAGSGVAGAAAAAATAAAGAAGSNPNKSPLSAQSYVSFWSKTFPTWVRKVLKQMRRRSLYNSSKRQQQQHHHNHHHHSAGVGQKIASSAVSSLTGESSSSSSSSSSNSASSSSS